MKVHANARLSLKGRVLLIDRVEKAPRASGSRAAVPRAVTGWRLAPWHPWSSPTARRSAAIYRDACASCRTGADHPLAWPPEATGSDEGGHSRRRPYGICALL
jgi:hypothetical protein